MSLRKQFSEEEIKGIGLRLKCCRVLTGLTQEEFAARYNFPYTTIRNWEFGRVIPRREGILKFIEALRDFNIFVECDWILLGHGAGPSYNVNDSEIGVIPSNIETFKAKIDVDGANPVVALVTDNMMMPWFGNGDLIGGTFIEAKDLHKLLESKADCDSYPVMVRLTNGTYAPRWPKLLGDKLVFANQYTHLEELNPVSVALIRWHEVKYPRS